MTSRLEWHGDEAKEYVRGRAVKFLLRAAIEVKREAQRSLGVAGTGVATRSLTTTIKGEKKTFKKGRRIYGKYPSKPGEPPHKQTGDLWRSVAYEVDRKEMIARVGTNKKHGKAMELGTKHGIAPRPWLRPALAKAHSRGKELLDQITDT